MSSDVANAEAHGSEFGDAVQDFDPQEGNTNRIQRMRLTRYMPTNYVSSTEPNNHENRLGDGTASTNHMRNATMLLINAKQYDYFECEVK
jgi:hypothetical protein